MKEQLYIDGFKEIHFIGGMVRAQMFVLEPPAEGEATQADAGQLVMNPQGFISALNAMQQLADRLIEAGVLQRTTPQGS